MSTALRLSGLLLLALLASWLVLRGCTPEPPPASSASAPEREAFHAAKPLLLQWGAVRPSPEERAWLTLELHWLLNHGRMNVAPAPIGLAHERESDAPEPFVLRVDYSNEHATLTLIAPDGLLEREHSFSVDGGSRLHIVRSFAAQLPAFLKTSHVDAEIEAEAENWTALIGFDDEQHYDAFTRAQASLLGPSSRGFTRSSGTSRARTVEQIERLSRRARDTARVQALLGLAYVSLGGEDRDSLTELARTRAARALALDPNIAQAHATLGLAALRESEWLAAHERFATALRLDPNDAAALEGFACLHADAGLLAEARVAGRRATVLQPNNVGALECLAYAAASERDIPAPEETSSAARAQVLALQALLDGDHETAERWLRAGLKPAQFSAWGRPLLRAARSKQHVPAALRALTSAASELQIDASTEIIGGAALRQSEFVFNRMARLQRDGEHIPLRLLWLPQTAFLREHPRFIEVIDAAGLPAFWQEHGLPDLCAGEGTPYGCARAGDQGTG